MRLSPSKRVAQHLDPSAAAKGNALGKQLRRERVNYEQCTFEMVAVGPIFPEQRLSRITLRCTAQVTANS
jgi:hypothetical protein